MIEVLLVWTTFWLVVETRASQQFVVLDLVFAVYVRHSWLMPFGICFKYKPAPSWTSHQAARLS